MRGTSSASAPRWLVGVTTSIVLAFLLATFASQHLEDAIASRANDIIGNAMPSVQYLSEARGSLHELERQLEREADGDISPEVQQRAISARQDLERALAAYVAVPFFASEKALFSAVTDGIATVDKDRAAYEVSHDRALQATLRRDFASFDRALERVVSFDAGQGERLGLEIEHIRAQSKGLVALLDGISVGLALLAVWLALRQVHRVRRAREAELRERDRREAELGAQNEALGQFAGRVAHDVLSPLGTAMLSLDVVREACATDHAAARAVDRGVAAVHHVHALVDALLAFSRAGGKPEPGVATQVAPVIADVVDGLDVQARAQAISLTATPVPGGAIACSAGVLTSLLTNLIRNAIKYMGRSPERRIEVHATATADTWRVEIADTGPGIAPDQQQRIFEPYVQLSRGSDGIGLGLATVDRLARAHGGRVGVLSEPGHGAMFWFELPRAEALPVQSVSSAPTLTVGSGLTRARARM